MIEGPDGLIIVDTGVDTDSAKRVLADFRKIADKPIRAIILTHGHGDHTGGLPVFAADGRPQIWAHASFGAESRAMSSAGLTINRVRGARQGGFELPSDQRINNGVAKAYWPERGGEVFHSTGSLAPTHTVSEPRHVVDIAGMRVHLVPTGGETEDHLYVWLPEKRVVFSGDNFYKSWPNLYSIRGTPYRDVNDWADAADRMLKEGPDALVGGHTRPVIGREKVAAVLTDYRDAIRYVFDKTVEGMNKGMTPDELVEFVKLPEHLASKDYLREYYGNVQWAVREIFAGHLGWFDGNPSNLFPLCPREEASRVAELAGGPDGLLKRAAEALARRDAQWAARLCDHLLAIDPTARTPKLIKAAALRDLAEHCLTATARNYYFSVANELEKGAASP